MSSPNNYDSIEGWPEVLKFWDWMDTTGDAKAIHIKTTTSELRSVVCFGDYNNYFSRSLIELSKNIDKFIAAGEKTREDFFFSDPLDWTLDSPLHPIYTMYKLAWLYKDIKLHGVRRAPQLYKAGHMYSTHPGGDRKLVLLDIIEEDMPVDVFYIWYPKLDPAPWHWTQDYEELLEPTDIFKLLDLTGSDNFYFTGTSYTINASGDSHIHNTDIDTSVIHPLINSIHETAVKQGIVKSDNWEANLHAMSYTDRCHRNYLYNNQTELYNAIEIVNDHTIRLYDYEFNKQPWGANYKEIWIPQRLKNPMPASLFDKKWTNSNATISFKRRTANVGKNRKWT